MQKNYPKKERGLPFSSIPRKKPLPKKTEESADSLYHIVIAIAFGVFLCLSMGALDYLSQDMTPTTDTTESIEHFG